MSVFQDIIKGMADGAEALQANFAKLAKAISAIDDDGTIHFGKVSAENLAVSGTGFSDVSNGSVALNSSAGDITANYRMNGRIVTIIFAGNSNSSTPSWESSTKIGSIPDGLPTPFGVVAARGILLDVTSGSNFASIQVNSNRDILLNANGNTAGNTHYWEGEITYMF